MSNNKLKAKRALTVTMSLALTITLSACSGATNNYGSLDKDETYASVGDYSVTYGELWDELKWSAQDLLSEQINNVALNKYINNIRNVLEKSYSDLSDSDKENLGIDDESDFNTLNDTYKNRLIDYVVQDVFSFTYSNSSYWDNVELYTDDIPTAIQKYVDGIYKTYQKDSLTDGTTYIELLTGALVDTDAEDHKDDFYKLGISLKEKFYPLLAKELLAFNALKEDVDEAFEDDEDEDDNMIGYYQNTSYVSKFKSEYTNKYDVDLVMIRFSTSTEYDNVLRAFGVKVYNKRFYFIRDNADDGYDDYLASSDRITVSAYNTLYDDFSTSQLTKEYGAYELTGEEVFELFIQIYNYQYSGYRTPLTSTVITKDTVLYTDGDNNQIKADYSTIGLNNLRNVTYTITKLYASDAITKYNANVESLKENNKSEITYYADDLKSDYSDTFRTYMYETLLLEDEQGYTDMHSRYTTSTQSANSAEYMVYKFDDEKDYMEGELITDEKLKTYQAFYKPSLSNYEILSYITDDSREDLFDTILNLLMQDDITESKISSSLSDVLEDVKVSIYNEAVEIGYKVNNSDYSNTILKASNENILATIEYDDVKWNLNIGYDETDENSIKLPGYDTPFSAFDYLEKTLGISTALNLLSKKIIKETNVYKETLNDEESRENYKTYIENLLVYFSNDYYSSSGYPASIGKYNFLMLYFHQADVNKILEENYLLSLATSKLLTNYSSTSLAEFFKKYTDLAYDKYFNLSATRLIVYFDRDDDDDADDVDFDDLDNWVNEEVTFEGETRTRAYVARRLIYDIYVEVAASSETHTTTISNLVTEINESSKAVYEENPIVTENKWAKYRYLGFKVKTDTVTATNSTTSIDFDLKQRLYDYARGHNEDNTETYQYFVNDTVPSLYMEMLTADDISTNKILATDDGFNMIVVTSGTAKSSAKWSESDYDNTEILKDIILKYNEEYVKIDDVFNEDEKLNVNQILLYVLDEAINGDSTLSAAEISDALSAYLSPVYERFTSDATQTIVLLNFIKSATNSTGELYDVVKFKNESYVGENGVFSKIIVISQDTADSYSRFINDTTNTSNTFENWWEELEAQVASFLQEDTKEAK